jgi:sigma-B regulation protein RsbU (phosphoserine phosphatase)
VVELGAGDRLLFYTDGLYECRNAADEMFGMPRIEQLLLRDHAPSARSCSDNILNALAAWRGGVEEFDDDVTYVVIDVL